MSDAPKTGTVVTGDGAIALEPGETVLEALEREGVDVPSGCRAGTCCKCMLQGEDPPPESQAGLRGNLRDQGYFLSCQAKPTGELRLLSRADVPVVSAHVRRVKMVAPDVAQILLDAGSAIEFRPGQYIDVIHASGAVRSYSIASLPSDGVLELHIRRVPNGHVSGWLHGLGEGDVVPVRGAFGQCYYSSEESDRKLLLVGAGTGLAPLLGIARDALASGHAGAVDLVHGGLDPARLYLRDELADLAARWPTLRVHHCVLNGATSREHEGRLDEIAVRLAGPLKKTRAFVCGDAAIVRTLQRSLFLAGLPSREILADPFEAATV